MSIQTEIQRLQNAKASIKASIINKGVEISDDVKLDEYSNLIDNIPTGENISNYFADNIVDEYGYPNIKSSIKKLPNNFNLSGVQNLDSLLADFINLEEIPLLDTSSATSLFGFASGCGKITTFPLLDISNVEYMGNFLSSCTSLISIAQLNTSSVKDISYAFDGCTMLQNVPLINLSACDTINNAFNGCNSLTNLGGFQNLGQAFQNDKEENYWAYALDLSSSTNLTHDSLMNVINNLYDIASRGCKKQTLNLGSTNLAKLTADEIAIATNKGWNVT